jgi:hypothetical protein
MDIFNTKKIGRLEEELRILKKEMNEVCSGVEEIKADVSEMQENMEEYKRYREEKELLKHSGEPWVDFETRVVDKDGRVEVKMDWNEEFIDYLKKEGFKASSDEELVSIYFSSLVREAGEEWTEEQAKKHFE